MTVSRTLLESWGLDSIKSSVMIAHVAMEQLNEVWPDITYENRSTISERISCMFSQIFCSMLHVLASLAERASHNPPAFTLIVSYMSPDQPRA